MTLVSMPQLGESVTEGTVTRWLKGVGDAVALDEPLCEIETEKVTAELPSPVAGRLVRVLAEVGETVAVGEPLCEIAETGPGNTPAGAPGARGEPGAGAEATAVSTAGAGRAERRRFSSPAVRRLAELHGVDLSQVSGTGLGGRVTRKDVEAFVARRPERGERLPADGLAARPVAAAERASAVAGPGGAGERLTGVRKTIAENLERSNREIPQAWTMVEVEMTRLVAAREQLQQRLPGRRVTLLPLFIAGVCLALREHPRLNARFEGEELRVHEELDIGVAVATEWGLVVPVIHDAGALSPEGLAARLEELIQRARERRLSIEEVEGGTFTVNNTGAFGSVASKPLVNPPQVAIVTLERVVKRPVVIEGDAIAVRPMANVCLSFDHRVMDGLDAGRFLATLKGLLEGWS